MNNKLIIAVVALAMTVPAGLVAAWGNSGQQEPSTTYDSGEVWPGAPQGAAETKVYFNIAQVNYVTVVGAIGSTSALNNFRTSYVYGGRFYGDLGFWRDCNADGYIGNRLLSRDNYPVAAAANAATTLNTICPPVASNTALNPVTSFDQRFNDGLIIHEFVAIGRNAPVDPITGVQADARDVNDVEAKVWADYGLPTDYAMSDVLLAPPFPRDSLRDGNSLLGYVSYLQFCDNPNVPSSPTKVCFSSSPTGVSGTHVNIQNLPTGVNDETAVLWDVKNLYNDSETRSDYGTPIIDPRSGAAPGGPCTASDPTTWAGTFNAGGSIAPTVNMISQYAVFEDCTVGGELTLFSNLEMDDPFDTSPSKGGKRAPDVGLAYSASSRYHLDDSALNGPYTNIAPATVTSAGAGGYGGSFWRIRNTPLECDTVNLGCRIYITGYSAIGSATVSAAGGTISLPSGATTLGTKKYGAAQCDFSQATPTPWSPLTAGSVISDDSWNCDEDVWQTAYDNQDPSVAQWYKILGGTYDLIDIDCFDGQLFDGIQLPTGQFVDTPDQKVPGSAAAAC